jgi:hypothetical protein
MKKLCTIVMLLTLGLSADAQSHVKGQIDLNLGLGLGFSYVSGYSSYTPPISLSGDYGITDDISVGLYFAYSGAKYKYSGSDFCNNGNGGGSYFYNYTDTYKWKFSILGIRGAYHFGKFVEVENLDLYAGLMLGNTFASFKFSTVTSPGCDKRDPFYGRSTYGGFAWSVYAGARYRFTEHIGAFAELGYGISYLTIGLNYKI